MAPAFRKLWACHWDLRHLSGVDMSEIKSGDAVSRFIDHVAALWWVVAASLFILVHASIASISLKS
jgi:hypothetical protein